MSTDDAHPPDYNFILNPPTQPKKSLLSNGGGKQRLMMMVIVGGLLILLIGIIVALVFGGSSSNTERLVGLVETQTELIRVAEVGEKDSLKSEVKNFAATARLSLTTAKNDLTTLAVKQDRKITAKELAAKQSKETDAALAAAKQNNRFDEVFEQTLKQELAEYQKELQAAYNNSGSKTEKALLQKMFNQVQVLLDSSQ